MKKLFVLPLFLLAGCAVPLSPTAEKVRLVSAQQKESCERIKLVTFNQRLGPDKPGNAMKSALNEAAAAGADSFFVVSSSTELIDGASVVGEALRCSKPS
jgi:hypothetical protein